MTKTLAFSHLFQLAKPRECGESRRFKRGAGRREARDSIVYFNKIRPRHQAVKQSNLLRVPPKTLPSSSPRTFGRVKVGHSLGCKHRNATTQSHSHMQNQICSLGSKEWCCVEVRKIDPVFPFFSIGCCLLLKHLYKPVPSMTPLSSAAAG